MASEVHVPPKDALTPGLPERPVVLASPILHSASPSSQGPDGFWDKIKRHKVVEWTLAYVAFGYATLHGSEMLRERHLCLATCYHALGDVRRGAQELKALQAIEGDSDAFNYAELYAQWGNVSRAIHWLTRAVELSDPGLQNLRNSWMLDPIRGDPRFKALERRLNFPP
jgi:hypothetical protein